MSFETMAKRAEWDRFPRHTDADIAESDGWLGRMLRAPTAYQLLPAGASLGSVAVGPFETFEEFELGLRRQAVYPLSVGG